MCLFLSGEQVLQPRVQLALASLRNTSLWQLLRDLYDATELPASLDPIVRAMGAHGINRLLLGGVVGAHEPGKELRMSVDQSVPNAGRDILAQMQQHLMASRPAPAREATQLDSDLARAARRNKLLYLEVWKDGPWFLAGGWDRGANTLCFVQGGGGWVPCSPGRGARI